MNQFRVFADEVYSRPLFFDDQMSLLATIAGVSRAVAGLNFYPIDDYEYEIGVVEISSSAYDEIRKKWQLNDQEKNEKTSEDGNSIWQFLSQREREKI